MPPLRKSAARTLTLFVIINLIAIAPAGLSGQVPVNNQAVRAEKPKKETERPRTSTDSGLNSSFFKVDSGFGLRLAYGSQVPTLPGTVPPRKETGSATDQSQSARSKSQVKLPSGSELNIDYDSARKEGDVIIFEGYVNATFGPYRIQADRITYNDTTKDLTAEGNVIFDADVATRITASHGEVNTANKRGVFYDTTGFTNRTADGRLLYFEAARIEKKGDDSYILYDTVLTACDDANMDWSFTTSRTILTVNDKAKLKGAVFRLLRIPILYLPFASLPISKRERQSGFLLPTTGSSTAKGRTFAIPYYQTLGDSVDLTLTGDIFTHRALELGYEARLRTDDRSFLRLGGQFVKDGLFGYQGPNQGGSSFYAYGAQYLPDGFVAVADANITSSLIFRQVFSDEFEEIVNPEERSTFYINRNFNGYSLNLLAQSRTTTIQVGNDPNFLPRINVRQLPSFEFASQPRPLSLQTPWGDSHEKLPIYLSFDAAVEGLHRNEQVNGVDTFDSPSIVQRFDLFPKVTVPLPSFGGWSVTPSIGFRTTFYSNSLDPAAPIFDPLRFALLPNDPRLNPQSPLFNSAITLFNADAQPRLRPIDLTRTYSELAIDLRPPEIGRTYRRADGSRRFTHVIESYITYRRIDGLNNFAFVPRFDERDAVARTDQLEYSIVNRFFRSQSSGGEGDSTQPAELLTVKLSQFYFFDPTFGGALVRGQRNQFYPLNLLTPFSFASEPHHFSPINASVRVRPLTSYFGDLRVDYDPNLHQFRDLAVGAGVTRERITVEESYYYTKQFTLPTGGLDPTSFPGSQLRTMLIYGDRSKGLYGGTSLNYNFANFPGSAQPAATRLLLSSSYVGYMGKCLGFEVGYQSFNAGIRVESRLAFSLTLSGIGSLGTRNRTGQRDTGFNGWQRNRLTPDYNDQPY